MTGVFICLFLASWAPFSSDACAKDDHEVKKLAENVYARIVSADGDAVSNAGFVVLENSVLVFDTHFTPEAGQALLDAIRRVSAKPVRYVVNSHGHADHTHGNQVFPDALLIGSSAARKDVRQVDSPSFQRTLNVSQSQITKLRSEIAQTADPGRIRELNEQIRSREDYLKTMSRLKITAPMLTFDDGLRILDGEEEVRILFLGRGHTDGDTALLIPSGKVAFLGDLFFNNAIPNVQDASILDWMKTLEEVLKLDAEIFVPGHGPVGSKKDVEQFLKYFQELHSLVTPVLERGDSLEQAVRDIALPSGYAQYSFQNFFPSNVQKLYAEIKALQAAAPKPQAKE